jgi:hypothetical protein
MITSASRRFLLASIKSFSPGGTGFFLPFDEKLEVHRGRSAAGGVEMGPDTPVVGQNLPLASERPRS